MRELVMGAALKSCLVLLCERCSPQALNGHCGKCLNPLIHLVSWKLRGEREREREGGPQRPMHPGIRGGGIGPVSAVKVAADCVWLDLGWIRMRTAVTVVVLLSGVLFKMVLSSCDIALFGGGGFLFF